MPKWQIEKMRREKEARRKQALKKLKEEAPRLGPSLAIRKHNMIIAQERQKELLTSDHKYTFILDTKSDPNSAHFDKTTETITADDAKTAEFVPLEWVRLGKNGMVM